MRLSALLCFAASTDSRITAKQWFLLPECSCTTPVPFRRDVSLWPSSWGLLIIYMASGNVIAVIILPNELNSRARPILPSCLQQEAGWNTSCLVPRSAVAAGFSWALAMLCASSRHCLWVPGLPQQQLQGNGLQQGVSRLQSCKSVTIICNCNHDLQL